MCTIAFLVDIVPEAPLVIAANRDELYARPTRPPERLGPNIAGGVDVLSGGTWLAVRKDGRFAAVTNQRALSTPPAGLRSRGLAVKELAAATDPDQYVHDLDPTRYASMNLAWGDANGVSIAYGRQEGALDVIKLTRGIHVLCNDKLGSAGFPRGERLHHAIDALVAKQLSLDALLDGLGAALGDHTRVPLADTPPSHLPPELGRELTAVCIHCESYASELQGEQVPLGYGTRSATLFAANRAGALAYRASDGRPCTNPFIDRMELLA